MQLFGVISGQSGRGRGGAGDPGALRLLTDLAGSGQTFRRLGFVLAAFLQPPSVSIGRCVRSLKAGLDELHLLFPSTAAARKKLIVRLQEVELQPAGRQKEATAARVHAYVNGRLYKC